MIVKLKYNFTRAIKKIALVLFFISLVNSYAQTSKNDSINHIFEVSLLPQQFYGNSEKIIYLKAGARLTYSYFLSQKFLLSTGATYYYTHSLYGSFDKKHQYLIDLIGRYYLERSHFDLGFHGGNLLEYHPLDTVKKRPKAMFYSSLGLGMTFAIKSKFTFDIGLKYYYALNNNSSQYKAKNYFEGALTFGYILNGNNNRFKRPLNKLKIKEILVKDVEYVYGSLGGAAFFNKGLQDIAFMPDIGYRRFLKDKISVNAGFIPSLYFSKNDSIYIGSKGYLPRKLNTFDVSLGGRYHFAFMYVGLGSRIGTYSNFKNWNDFDRKVRVKLELEYGAYIRLNNYWLLEYRSGFSFNTANFYKNAPTAGYHFTQLFLVKKFK